MVIQAIVHHEKAQILELSGDMREKRHDTDSAVSDPQPDSELESQADRVDDRRREVSST